MSDAVESLLPAYLLGELSQEELPAVEEHLSQCPRCEAALRELSEVMHLPALALPEIAPPPALRERLMASVAALEPPVTLLQRVARVLDLTLAEVRRLLDRVQDPAAWIPTPAAGIRLFHLAGGPATAGADCGLVQLDKGVRFPLHRHLGLELGVVVRGSYLDSAGHVVRCGDEVRLEPETSHSFLALEDLLLVVRAHQGIDMLDQPLVEPAGIG